MEDALSGARGKQEEDAMQQQGPARTGTGQPGGRGTIY
jgi:hypothetical protein